MVGCDQLCLLPNQITESFDHFDYQYLWKGSIDILTFCIEIVIKGRQHVRLSFPVKWGQVGFLSNLIAQFSDHQYLWNELSDILDFFQGDNHQEKGVSETATFGWVCQGVLLIQSDCRILWSLIFFEGIIWYPRFLACR